MSTILRGVPHVIKSSEISSFSTMEGTVESIHPDIPIAVLYAVGKSLCGVDMDAFTQFEDFACETEVEMEVEVDEIRRNPTEFRRVAESDAQALRSKFTIFRRYKVLYETAASPGHSSSRVEYFMALFSRFLGKTKSYPEIENVEGTGCGTDVNTDGFASGVSSYSRELRLSATSAEYFTVSPQFTPKAHAGKDSMYRKTIERVSRFFGLW